ncbi:MAG: hypothetical protein ACYTHN_06135 [Planctomycetota bacterium]|jgi:hypothetical protein
MRSSFLRMGMAVVGASVAYFAVFLAALQEEVERVHTPETIAVKVRDAKTDPWIQEEKKRLEAKEKKLQAEKTKLADERKMVEEDLRRIEKMAAKMTAREEAVNRLETQLRKAREDADLRAEMLLKREAEVEAERESFTQRQKELEELAASLVEQQKDLASRTKVLEEKESSVEAREKEAKELARTLIDSQKEIQDKQKSLENLQRDLNESQTERDREWQRIKDEWKKIENQRKALEAKLESAKSTAADWEALKEEWRKLEGQRKKLEEAQDVRENVDRFKKQFDRSAYLSRLNALRGAESRKKVESEFIRFDFYFATEELRKKHLGFYGMMDIFYNEGTKKYAVKRNYNSPSFDTSGTWTPETARGIYDVFSKVALQRDHGFYTSFARQAADRIGGPRSKIRIFGLMPVGMVYECVLHQRRVMELMNLVRKDVKRFQFAPWYDQGEGKWRFKVISVTVSNGRSSEVRKVGLYNF